MPDEPQGHDGVETLARTLMGWKRGWEVLPDAKHPQDWYFEHGGRWWHHGTAGVWWNPFGSANLDLQVLETVRGDTWKGLRLRGTVTAMDSFWSNLRRLWNCRPGVNLDEHHVLFGSAMSYECGDFARAALAVLKEMEAEG